MTQPLSDIPASRLPAHIAIIMDGNGRWARRQGQPRVFGHQHGAQNVRDIVTECARLNTATGRPRCLTLYSFSTENWKRPADEVAFLMGMYVEYLRGELPTMQKNNIRFRQIGRQEGLPAEVVRGVQETIDATAGNTGLTLTLAVNYGSRAEIVDAVRAIASKVRSGEMDLNAIDEGVIDAHLYTAGLCDPDLLIRTAGEMRLSNYLLWQMSYAEIYVTQTLWPDFTPADLHIALREFAARERRFGGISAK